RPEPGFGKRLFQVNLRARTGIAGRALGFDRRDDAVARPTFGERAGAYEDIGLIGGVLESVWRRRRAQRFGLRRRAPNPLRVPPPRLAPFRHPAQLRAADRRLHRGHAIIAAERFVQPAKAGRMLAGVYGPPRLAVIL